MCLQPRNITDRWPRRCLIKGAMQPLWSLSRTEIHMINRRNVIRTVSIMPLVAGLPHIEAAAKATPGIGGKGKKMPVLFIGHGSPMNAISDNPFTRALSRWGASLSRPAAILVVSAHWLTKGSTAVLSHPRPPTIHDFRGFPRQLHELQYPASGHPALARQALELIGQGDPPNGFVGPRPVRKALSEDWGLDHGTWSVLVHLFPRADVPVFQVSVDMDASASHHAGIARNLDALRSKGVLIIGSGNIVHNLRRTQRGLPEADQASQTWAQSFDDQVAQALSQREDRALLEYTKLRGAYESVPTPDHYWPLVYALGAARDDGPPKVIYQSFQSGTISMRSLQFG